MSSFVKVKQEISNYKIAVIIEHHDIKITQSIISTAVTSGIRMVLISTIVPQWSRLIHETTIKYPKIMIGLYTNRSVSQVELAIAARAQFIVGVNFLPEILAFTTTKGILYIPGIQTLNELTKVLDYGIDTVNLYPAGLTPPQLLIEYQRFYKQVNFFVSGGVDETKVNDYLNKDAFGIGLSLVENSGYLMRNQHLIEKVIVTKFANLLKNASQTGFKLTSLINK